MKASIEDEVRSNIHACHGYLVLGRVIDILLVSLNKRRVVVNQALHEVEELDTEEVPAVHETDVLHLDTSLDGLRHLDQSMFRRQRVHDGQFIESRR